MDANDIAIIESLLNAQQKQLSSELSGQFNLIANDLAHIKEQTTKTNGRVTKLESQMQGVLLAEAGHEQFGAVIGRVDKLEKSELQKQSIYRFLIWFGTALGALAATTAALNGIFKFI